MRDQAAVIRTLPREHRPEHRPSVAITLCAAGTVTSRAGASTLSVGVAKVKS